MVQGPRSAPGWPAMWRGEPQPRAHPLLCTWQHETGGLVLVRGDGCGKLCPVREDSIFHGGNITLERK